MEISVYKLQLVNNFAVQDHFLKLSTSEIANQVMKTQNKSAIFNYLV